MKERGIAAKSSRLHTLRHFTSNQRAVSHLFILWKWLPILHSSPPRHLHRDRFLPGRSSPKNYSSTTIQKGSYRSLNFHTVIIIYKVRSLLPCWARINMVKHSTYLVVSGSAQLGCQPSRWLKVKNIFFFEGFSFLRSQWAIYTVFKHPSPFGILIYCERFPHRAFPSAILFLTLLNTKSLIKTMERRVKAGAIPEKLLNPPKFCHLDTEGGLFVKKLASRPWGHTISIPIGIVGTLFQRVCCPVFRPR